MARYHWWGFIVNEAGEPIENAEITVKLAGSDELACLYYDEFSTECSCDIPSLSGGPQLTTLSNGYYEFWIGDSSETYGYVNTEKFKIEWIRIGVAYGMVDYVNIFPLGPQSYPVSLDCVSPSQTKDKLISNYMACKWDTHADFDVVSESGGFISIHGLEFFNFGQFDSVPNKIIDNYYGTHWEYHRLSTIQDYNLSAGPPHGLEEVNPLDGGDTTRNKVVSNADLWNLSLATQNLSAYVDNSDNYLQIQIDDISDLTDTSKAGWWIIYNTDWIYDADNRWYADLTHNLDIWYPFVVCWDMDTNNVINSTDITFNSVNSVRISIDNEEYPNDPSLQLAVRIATGGIYRAV